MVSFLLNPTLHSSDGSAATNLILRLSRPLARSLPPLILHLMVLSGSFGCGVCGPLDTSESRGRPSFAIGAKRIGGRSSYHGKSMMGGYSHILSYHQPHTTTPTLPSPLSLPPPICRMHGELKTWGRLIDRWRPFFSYFVHLRLQILYICLV